MNFVFPHPLDTPRLRLRTFREEDAAPLFAMMSDPEVMRYWNTPPWTTPAQAREAILRDSQALVDGEYLNLAIERREDGQLLGSCILFHFEKGSRRANSATAWHVQPRAGVTWARRCAGCWRSLSMKST